MRKLSIPPGTVFSMELGEGRYGLGLVTEATPLGEYFIVVFDTLSPDHEFCEWEQELERAKPVLAGLTLDAKFFHGNWVAVGKATDAFLARIPHPLYSVLWSGKPVIERIDASKATRHEIKHGGAKPVPRITSAPVVFDDALRAQHGLAPWEAHFDQLRYDNYFRT